MKKRVIRIRIWQTTVCWIALIHRGTSLGDKLDVVVLVAFLGEGPYKLPHQDCHKGRHSENPIAASNND